MTLHETLRCMRDLLQDKSRWTQRVLAVDSNGERCGTMDPDAAAFCVVGAALHCQGTNLVLSGDASGDPIINDLGRLLQQWPNHYYSSVFGLNDDVSSSHANVLTFLDFAITQTAEVAS